MELKKAFLGLGLTLLSSQCLADNVSIDAFCQMDETAVRRFIEASGKIDNKLSMTRLDFNALDSEEQEYVKLNGYLYGEACDPITRQPQVDFDDIIPELRLGHVDYSYRLKPISAEKAHEYAFTDIFLEPLIYDEVETIRTGEVVKKSSKTVFNVLQNKGSLIGTGTDVSEITFDFFPETDSEIITLNKLSLYLALGGEVVGYCGKSYLIEYIKNEQALLGFMYLPEASALASLNQAGCSVSPTYR